MHTYTHTYTLLAQGLYTCFHSARPRALETGQSLTRPSYFAKLHAESFIISFKIIYWVGTLLDSGVGREFWNSLAGLIQFQYTMVMFTELRHHREGSN